MSGSLLWNHWFWITLLTVSGCSCDSLLVQPYKVPAPLLQSFAMADLVRETGQGEPDDIEPFIASDGGRNVMVSKSVSVSRVSVEMGGVRVGKKIGESVDKLQVNKTSDNVYENNDSKNSVNPQSFFQKLVSQLKSIAGVNSGETSEEKSDSDFYFDSSLEDTNAVLSPGEEYTLVYRDEEYVGDDEYLADEYLNYNYYYGDSISDAYGDIIDISELVPGDYRDMNYDIIDYNENAEGEENEQFAGLVIDNQSHDTLDNLVTVNTEPALVLPSPASIRSHQARGRSLILQEASEEIFETDNDVLKSEQVVFMKEAKDILNNNEEEQLESIIEFSSSKPTLELNIKIGIFVGVALGVLVITVVAVLVLRRKVKSAKLVIDEDESTTDSQFAFSRGLTNNSSVIQEHFNNNFGKQPVCYPSDDLHSLDNDSFLTSLETIWD